jgi:hypothetical protein
MGAHEVVDVYDLRGTEATAEDRGALAKMVMTLLEHWRLSTEDRAALLGIATRNHAESSNYRKGIPIGSRDESRPVRKGGSPFGHPQKPAFAIPAES